MTRHQTHPRDGLIDGLRGLAMLGVIAIHLAARVPADHPAALLAQRVDHLGRFGVPLFILVLGVMAVRHYAPRPTGLAWLGRRLVAVGWPYLVWASLYALVAPWDGATSDGRPLAGDWASGEGFALRVAAIVGGYSAEHLWYMPAYLTLVLALPLLLWPVRRLLGWPDGARILAALLFGLAAAQIALLSYIEQWVRRDVTPPLLVGWLLRAEGRIALQWLGFFAAGGLLELVRSPPPTLPGFQAARAVFGVLIFGGLALRLPASPRFDDFWCSPAIAGSLAAFLLWAPVALQWGADARVVAWLRSIGRHSLPIYLSHVLWLRLGWWAGERWGVAPGLLAAGAATLLGSWLYIRVHGRIFGATG